jgi:ligand-binding sensor domain-containing protein
LAGIALALAQTAVGYLWVGTTQGLYRFNGISFEQYQPGEGKFPSRSILSLFADRSGDLWIGYLKAVQLISTMAVSPTIPFAKEFLSDGCDASQKTGRDHLGGDDGSVRAAGWAGIG